MVKFRMYDATHKLLDDLGLEYQYNVKRRGVGLIHQNRFCMLDGTDILELRIEEDTGNVQIKDKQGIQDYSSLDLKDLHLMIINIGDTLTPRVPFIYIRILAGRHVLHHSEYKQ